MAELTAAQEIRTAAARLRAALPDYAAGTAYVVQGDSESMDTIAWCNTDHSDDPAPACCVEAIETGHPALAQLIAALLNAREPLAAWLEMMLDTYSGLQSGASSRKPPPNSHLARALTVARAVNGAAL